EAQGVRVKTSRRKNLPPVYIDQDHLSRILINLLSNAIKFTAAGGKVEISTSLSERGHRHWVAIRVRDTGIGIAEEDLPHLFKRFYRSRGAQIVGTGLGLAIVHELVSLHGGEITLESKLGQGTLVTCWLPPAKIADEQAQ